MAFSHHDFVGLSENMLHMERDDRCADARFAVQHNLPSLGIGDTVRWIPTSIYGRHLLKDPATFRVIANAPGDGQSTSPRWRAEFGRLEVDVTVAGETHKAPSQGFPVYIEDRPNIDRWNPNPKRTPY